jgi:hypothetical protein
MSSACTGCISLPAPDATAHRHSRMMSAPSPFIAAAVTRPHIEQPDIRLSPTHNTGSISAVRDRLVAADRPVSRAGCGKRRAGPGMVTTVWAIS